MMVLWFTVKNLALAPSVFCLSNQETVDADRTVEGLSKFIKEHASIAFELPGTTAEASAEEIAEAKEAVHEVEEKTKDEQPKRNEEL